MHIRIVKADATCLMVTRWSLPARTNGAPVLLVVHTESNTSLLLLKKKPPCIGLASACAHHCGLCLNGEHLSCKAHLHKRATQYRLYGLGFRLKDRGPR